DGSVEFGAVGSHRDVLSLQRGHVDLGGAGVDADAHIFHVGGVVELGGEVFLHFDENIGVGGGWGNDGLEELVAHEIHAGFGSAQSLVAALFILADKGGGVGGGIEADGQE